MRCETINIDLNIQLKYILSFKAEVINYSGDLNTPPDAPKSSGKTTFIGKKKVKGRGKRTEDSDSDDNDW